MSSLSAELCMCWSSCALNAEDETMEETADLSLRAKGSRNPSNASSPPNILMAPPNLDSITVLDKASKAGEKSASSTKGDRSIFCSSLAKKSPNCSLVKNCFIIMTRIDSLNISKFFSITPEPYNKGTRSKSICMASWLVIAPESANSP